jgi:DNA-directed RNA polymerase subunit K/omega
MLKNKKGRNPKPKTDSDNDDDDDDEISSQEDNIDTEDIIDTNEDEDEDEDEEDGEEGEEGEGEEGQGEGEEEVNDCVIDKAIEEDNIFFDTYLNSDIELEKNGEEVLKENRISANRLTKYEMVRILGERTKQLKMGAKALIKNSQDLSYEKIAEEELKVDMIPFKIKRELPNGMYEIWLLHELNKEHLLSYLE